MANIQQTPGGSRRSKIPPVIGDKVPQGRGRKGRVEGPAPEVSARKAPGQRSPRLSGNAEISFNTCVKTLSGVTISRRGLLHLELAVGLAVFMDAGKADKHAKAMLQEIYARAGYDCAASDGADYKTVNRRIQASAGLFGKISLEVLNHWADKGGKETKLLQAFAHEITSFGFKSMDDVLDHVGRTSNRTQGSGAAKRAERAWDIEVGTNGEAMHVKLPKTLTEAQLIELGHKILALAETVHEAALKAAVEGEKAPAAVQAGAGEAAEAGVGVGAGVK